MSLPLLSMIPAGAGSGKTYTIQQRLAQWIVEEKIRPERILAVTFTEAAASELRERIRAELLDRGMQDAALRLEQSTISTIHSFGLRVLVDYCFEVGISPLPRLLSEDEEDSLIRHAMSETDRADSVMDNLSGYGYRYDFIKGTTAEEAFRQRVLDLISVLRVIGRDEEDSVLVQYAREYVSTTYGECDDPGPLKAALQEAVETLLVSFPDDWSRTITPSKAATKDFRENHRDLCWARGGASLERDWALWNRLRTLRVSGKGVDLPDEYIALAQRVMDAAEGILQHPGPREQALSHLDALFGAAHDSLARHTQAKRDAALLDYTDMLSVAMHILRSDSAVLEDLAGRVDCMVVDEFQDTNPLQFSLLWMLHHAGVPALIVGDRKQAIMRFQHADARLMESLEGQHSEALEPLRENWRTRPNLLEWMNAVGSGLFGGEYQRLEPRAEFPSSMHPLEFIDWQAKGRSNVAPYHTALRIHTLLNDPDQQCYDRRSKITRRLRGEDIAVLCPTHPLLEKYAEALRGLGLRVRVEQEGWFESRIVQLAYYGLAYLTDPDDAHARLYLAVTELGPYTLESALRCLVENDALEVPLFEKLAQVSNGATDRTVTTLLDELITALDLYGVCGRWSDGRQSRANLIRLRAEAQAFVDTNPESLASGGYFGGSIKAFLAWLIARVERENTQPEAQVVDEDAIYLSTWHSAKGREWPVVAVCGMYKEIAPRLPDVDVQYPVFDDLENILPEARIQYSPDFVVPEIASRFTDPLQALSEDDARRLLYVVLTRAREKVILEWPSHLVDKDKVTHWSILQDAVHIELEDGVLNIDEHEYPVVVTIAGKKIPPEYHELVGQPLPPQPAVSRQSIQPGSLPESLSPEAITPSGLSGNEVDEMPEIDMETVAPALDFVLEVEGVERGTLLHRCLEVLRGDVVRIGLLEEATNYVFTDEQQQAITATVEGFEAWVASHFKLVAVEREIPVLGMNAAGSVIAGAIDLLIETADGYWIIDYKSDRVDDPESKLTHYLPQLFAYVDALMSENSNRKVLGVGIFWLSTGVVSLVTVA